MFKNSFILLFTIDREEQNNFLIFGIYLFFIREMFYYFLFFDIH